MGKPCLAVDRFWRYVKKTDDCWLWTGKATRAGYGRLKADRQRTRWVSAHRLSWQIHFGDPGELKVLHKCDNRACVRPDHLFIGTQADNITDMYAKGRNRVKPAYGERARHAKLTNEIVLEIRRHLARGENQYSLASRYGVAQPTISDIATRRTWPHI